MLFFAEASPVWVSAMLEWIKAAGTVFAAISLYLAYRQLRANVRWNRINATFTYLPEALFIERERAAAAALETIEKDLYQQTTSLEPKAVDALLNNSNAFRDVKDFLNLLENYAAAHKAGAIDPDHSYILNASQFIRYYDVFQTLIEKIRSERNNEMFWVEFEVLANEKWRPRQKDEIERGRAKRLKDRHGPSYP